MQKIIPYVLFVLSIFVFRAFADNLAEDIHESVTSIPINLQPVLGRQVSGNIIVTQFKPDGDGPFPIVILNHGRSPTDRAKIPRFRLLDQVRFFTARGFAVFLPTRLGYGDAGVEPDPENGGNCLAGNYMPMAEAGSAEVLATLDYAKQQAYVNPDRVLIVGQSAGGFISVATAAKNPKGLVAAINFAGGAGGDPASHPGVPCQEPHLRDMYETFGATAKVPMLWIYTENDRYFLPEYTKAWHDVFVKAGGQAEFKLLPPFAQNGHTLFADGIDVWAPIVSAFLDRLNFVSTPASDTPVSVPDVSMPAPATVPAPDIAVPVPASVPDVLPSAAEHHESVR